MAIILQQLFVLYAFLLLGFCFGKAKPNLVPQTGLLSFLIVYLFLPCKVFNTFSKNFTVTYLKEKYTVIAASLCILLFLHFLSKFICKYLHKDPFLKKVYEYTLTISNYAYMGYALMEGLYGEAGLTDLIVFCIPFAMYTYTVGYVKLTGSDLSLKRLINPMTCSLVLGIFFGLCGISLPTAVRTIFSNSASCVGTASMLLTGITLSTLSFRQVLTDKISYVVVFLRLVGIPGILFCICKLFGLHEVLLPALFMSAMPSGLNTIVFTKSAGLDPGPGARLAVMSHLFSVLTIPFWLSLL